MRLDAAKLKGCFGSWFLRRACYPVKQSANSARPERTRLPGRVFSFLASTLLRQGVDDQLAQQGQMGRDATKERTDRADTAQAM